MRITKRLLVFTIMGFTFWGAKAQEETPEQEEGSIIQTLTPSKLIAKGQFDVKWFNNLYTQTKSANGNGDVSKNEPRATFFTSTSRGIYWS